MARGMFVAYIDPMNLETLRNFFFWSWVTNYMVLILWYLFYAFAHDTLKALFDWAFRRPTAQFDSLNVFGITIYKIGVVLFMLTPWIVLTLLR